MLAQHRHVIHAPQNAAVSGPSHDQPLVLQGAEGGGWQAFAGEFAADQPGHEAMRVAQAGGAHVGLEHREQRARVGE